MGRTHLCQARRAGSRMKLGLRRWLKLSVVGEEFRKFVMSLNPKRKEESADFTTQYRTDFQVRMAVFETKIDALLEALREIKVEMLRRNDSIEERIVAIESRQTRMELRMTRGDAIVTVTATILASLVSLVIAFMR